MHTKLSCSKRLSKRSSRFKRISTSKRISKPKRYSRSKIGGWSPAQIVPLSGFVMNAINPATSQYSPADQAKIQQLFGPGGAMAGMAGN